ncbi:MAG: SLBB domain-containing protein [Verrucomicrobiota bacterium]
MLKYSLFVMLGIAGFIISQSAVNGQAMFDRTDEPIRAGDSLRIVMREDTEVEYKGEVSAAGSVPIPYLGEFPITGLTPDEAEEELEKALKEDLYNKATVSVTLLKKALGRIYVYGAVEEPGVVEIPDASGLTMLQLIVEIGGLTRWAEPADAFILRRGREGEEREKIDLNLETMFETAVPGSEEDVRLQANDTVCIPGRSGGLFELLSVEDAEVYVVGEVQSEESLIYFSPGERRTLFRAILKAGGFTKFAKTNAVRVISYPSEDEREEQVVDASAIVEEGELDEDVPINAGDMIIVPQKRVSF